MNVRFAPLCAPTAEIVAALNRWENDPDLIPLIRLNRTPADLDRRTTLTPDDLIQRQTDHASYLIYLDEQLVGEMDYQIDPAQLYRPAPGSAWIGILIGEAAGRGRGVGYVALQFLEEQIKAQGLRRIELGVFEYNTRAIKLYRQLGYQEFARLNDFAYWQGRYWQDIRLEKYLQPDAAGHAP